MDDRNHNQTGGKANGWKSPSHRLAAGHPDPMLGVQLVSGGATLAWCNPSARKELCLPADQGQPIGLDTALDAAVVPPDVRDAIWQAIQRDRDYHKPSGEGGSYEIEVISNGGSCDGTGTREFVIVFRCTHKACAEHLSVPGAGLLGNDTARETVGLLVQALDALSAEVALLNASGTIVAVNRAWRDFARQNGYQSDDAGVGSNYLAICDSATGPSAHEARSVASGLRAVLNGEESSTHVEYPCDSPDEQRWFQVRASGFGWQGRRFAVVSHESLTESKRAEQQHRQQLDELAHQWRMSSLGELASGIAHELNQPLGAITNYMNGCLRRLEAGKIDRDQLMKAARECAELAEFAAGVIKRMRGFATHTKSQYQPTGLNGVVAKAVQFFKASPESGHVHLMVDLARELPSVRADDVQIQQVVLNLLRNAGEAAMSGAASRGRVEVNTFQDSDGMVCLAVTDNGPGLPDGSEGRLFEPFFSTKSKGMGLGLSISKTIAEVHGGRLHARSIPSGGAVFELRLPAIIRAQSPSVSREAITGPSAASLQHSHSDIQANAKEAQDDSSRN
ncbi:MAG: hypothetical protein HRU13_06030 [Phycisphaerales bacterium]|nr:hypothetical protein [Phycisphaerales bacterium]